jgi:hypothetical protein
MDQEKIPAPVRAGMKWGGIGGIVGFLVSLLGSLAGVVAAIFIGVVCGRASVEGSGEAREERNGAFDGLVGGSLAAPVFVLGAAAGAIVGARRMGMDALATEMANFTGMELSPDQMWELLLTGIVVAGVVQALVVMGVAALVGARRSKKK